MRDVVSRIAHQPNRRATAAQLEGPHTRRQFSGTVLAALFPSALGKTDPLLLGKIDPVRQKSRWRDYENQATYFSEKYL